MKHLKNYSSLVILRRGVYPAAGGLRRMTILENFSEVSSPWSGKLCQRWNFFEHRSQQRSVTDDAECMGNIFVQNPVVIPVSDL